MTSPVVFSIPLPKKGANCQQLLSDRSVVHYGILRKRSAVNKLTDTVVKKMVSSSQQIIRWPKRYVVLLDGCMYMFKEETSSKATYASSLYGYNSVLPCTEEVHSKLPWPFRIIHALNDKELTLYFSAPTERDMKVWIEHLEQQLIYANGFNAAGFLAKRGGPSVQQQISLGGPKGLNPPTFTSSGRSTAGSAISGSAIDSELIYVSDDDSVDDDDDKLEDYDDIEDLDLVKSRAAAKLTASSAPQDLKNTTTSGDCRSATAQAASPVTPIKPFRKLQPNPTDTGLASRPLQNPKPLPERKPALPAPPKPNAIVKPCVASSSSSAVPGGGSNGGGVTRPFKQGRSPISPLGTQASCGSVDNAEYVSGEEYQEITTCLEEEEEEEEGLRSARWEGEAQEADEKMKKIKVLGAYMIRPSQQAGYQTLLVKSDTVVRKYKIQCNPVDAKYKLVVTDPGFLSLTELIEYYKSHNPPHQTHPLTLPYTAALGK